MENREPTPKQYMAIINNILPDTTIGDELLDICQEAQRKLYLEYDKFCHNLNHSGYLVRKHVCPECWKALGEYLKE
jgi:hypothetical protein